VAATHQPEKRILLVEDDALTRDALTMVLEGAGYTVEQAANGLAALRRLRSAPRPALIVLDMVMPVMNGWEFIWRQQEEPDLAGIPVVVFTAAYEAVPRAAAQLHVARVLAKPVDCLETLAAISDLFETIEQHC
jgi:CheY-like chemotaxis protein